VAAVQVLPTLARLADSPRAGGIDEAAAAEWSARPIRVVELVHPRFFGDPGRAAEGLFFAAGVHDRSFPYLLTLYPGLAVTVLGLAGMTGVRIPRRPAWAAMALTGAVLGVGRHFPAFPWLHAHLPVLGMVRFPEKFLLLSALALAFAAALTWDRLLDPESAARRACAVPLAIGGAVCGLAAAWVVVARSAPNLVAAFVRSHAPPDLSPDGVTRGVAFLQAESLRVLLVAFALLLVLAWARWGRRQVGAVAVVGVALLAADLLTVDQGLVRTLPAAELVRPPELARRLAGHPGRLHVQPLPPVSLAIRPGEDPELAHLRWQLASLQPYSGNLWNLSHALHSDYDLMLTHWGRRAMDAAATARRVAQGEENVLAAWNVGATVRFVARPGTVAAAPAEMGVLARRVRPLGAFRGVREVTFHPRFGAASEAVRGQAFEVAARDHWVGRPPAAAADATAAHVRSLGGTGARWTIDYSAADGGGLLVAAMTYDRGWRAQVGGGQVELFPTALGQIGAVLPAGDHRLELAYRDPLLRPAAALSALGVALLAVPWAMARVRPRPGGGA
jgi:hypothetical protein